MIEAAIQEFSVTLEALFPRPVHFAKEKIDQIAKWLTDPKEGFGLRPEQVHARLTDVVFDYDLKASFYGGNATFYYGPEKTYLVARGAKVRRDADLLHETAMRFARFTTSGEKLSLMFAANAHAALPSVAVREQYLSTIRPDTRVIHPGVLGYVEIGKAGDTVRVAIEPSFSAPKNLFFAWQMNLNASDDWQNTLEGIVSTIEQATAIYGIQFQPLSDS